MNKPTDVKEEVFLGSLCHFKGYGQHDCKIIDFQEGNPIITILNVDQENERVVKWEDIRLFKYEQRRKFINKF